MLETTLKGEKRDELWKMWWDVEETYKIYTNKLTFLLKIAKNNYEKKTDHLFQK